MHAAGNDFVVVDLVAQDSNVDSQIANTWAHRRVGIGCDQLLLVGPPQDEVNDFELAIFNSDGSPAEQCGNGTACVAKFVRDQGLTTKRTISFHTPGGNVETRLKRVIDSIQESVEVDLGPPQLDTKFVPFLADGRSNSYSVDIKGSADSLDLTPLSMGNPHAVMLVDDLNSVDVQAIGESIQQNDRFPESTNVEFVEIVSRTRIKLRVFERGAGETMACGTGACAAVVAARLQDRVDHSIQVEQPGGTVQVSWLNEQSPVKISVTAVRVFEGII